MLRRSLGNVPQKFAFSRSSSAVSTAAAASRFTFVRFGGGHVGSPQPPMDHSGSMLPRALNDAATKAAVDEQANRTVSGMVPGKLFMRHWIANEQATESIVNRIVSLGITAGVIVWASVYASSGPFACLSSAHFALLALIGIFLPLHTHHNWHGGVIVAAYFVAVYFNLLA